MAWSDMNIFKFCQNLFCLLYGFKKSIPLNLLLNRILVVGSWNATSLSGGNSKLKSKPGCVACQPESHSGWQLAVTRLRRAGPGPVRDEPDLNSQFFFQVDPELFRIQIKFWDQKFKLAVQVEKVDELMPPRPPRRRPSLTWRILQTVILQTRTVTVTVAEQNEFYGHLQ